MTYRARKFSRLLIVLLTFLLVMSSTALGADSRAVLKEVRDFIKENYILPVNENVLRQDTVEKIIKALGDPHSEYLSPEEFRDLMDSTSGYYTGVGIELTLQQYGGTLYPTVVATFDGSPAKKAGIVPGDRIIAVNGESTAAKSIDYTVSLIKGVPGTKVFLTIDRDSAAAPFTVSLTRELIEVGTVVHRMLEDNIGYIGMPLFSMHSGKQVRNAVNALIKQGCVGIILDLRNNPGGYLEAGVQTAEIFVPHGKPILHICGRKENITIESEGNPVRIPLAVLINGESASAAEIVAGAIKDYGVGAIVGTNTFGKGTVQAVQELKTESDAAVKLTVAEYLSPKGTKINGVGVTPDYYVEDPEAQLEIAKLVVLSKAQGFEVSGIKTMMLDPLKGTAYINGLKVSGSGEPFLDKNVVMVPLRLLGSYLEGNLAWNNDSKIAVLECGYSRAVIQVGSNSVQVDSKTVPLPAPAKIVNGRVYVPLRLLSSFQGLFVNWDPVLRCAEVTKR